MPAENEMLIHGTCIAVASKAVLFRGPSGAGKSDLALRCLTSPALPDAARAAGLLQTITGPINLVSDDQVQLCRQGDVVVVRAPAAICGKIEVRGIGIVDMPIAEGVPLALILDLVGREHVPRMPAPFEILPHNDRCQPLQPENSCETAACETAAELAMTTLLGVQLPRMSIAAFEQTAPLKVLLALDRLPLH